MSNTAAAAFLKAVDENEVLRADFASTVPQNLSSISPIVEFARQRGFEFTEQEFHEVASANARGELSEEQLSAVAGGGGTSADGSTPYEGATYAGSFSIDSFKASTTRSGGGCEVIVGGTYNIGGTTYEIDKATWGALFGGS